MMLHDSSESSRRGSLSRRESKNSPYTSITDSTRNLLRYNIRLCCITRLGTHSSTRSYLTGTSRSDPPKKNKEKDVSEYVVECQRLRTRFFRWDYQHPRTSKYMFLISPSKNLAEKISDDVRMSTYFTRLSRCVLLFHINGTHCRVLLVWRLLQSENLR